MTGGAQDVERIVGISHASREAYPAAVQARGELLSGVPGGDGDEDGADRAVEVERDVLSASEKRSQVHRCSSRAEESRYCESLSERDDGSIDSGGSPKSDAGQRTVSAPALILPDLVAHLAEFTDPERNAFVFLGENGGRLRRSNFRRATHWRTTVERVGLPPGFHFHDLRHTGNQLAAEAAPRPAS